MRNTMKMFLTIEAQNVTRNGLSDILREVNCELSFVTNQNAALENENNYGLEFRVISIIPSCVDDSYWNALGWSERLKIWRSKKEVDVRLRMDYNRFINETKQNQKIMFVDIIAKSIRLIMNRSVGDFKGEELITDILKATKISAQDLNLK